MREKVELENGRKIWNGTNKIILTRYRYNKTFSLKKCKKKKKRKLHSILLGSKRTLELEGKRPWVRRCYLDNTYVFGLREKNMMKCYSNKTFKR